MAEDQSNIKQSFSLGNVGLNMDNLPSQLKQGQYSYALNGIFENFDDSSASIQNEPGNEFCVEFPDGYVLIGKHTINEINRQIFFITNPITEDCQIGYTDNNDCTYNVLVNSPCLNFNIHHPIHKVVHKINNCSTEIYWTDGYNPRRYLDINNIPKILRSGTPLCSPIYTDDVDCNQLRVQPDFDIPLLSIENVINGGNLIAGTYQFAVQYADALGNPYTSYYSVTNPTPIADVNVSTVNFNYAVGKSIVIDVSNLDTTGQYTYFNIAVIKTINDISSVELIGTYSIEGETREIVYSGQTVDNIRLTINDIFEKYPYYEIAQDLTTAQDVLIWDQLSSIDRINYQEIASNIELNWETWRIPATESYADEINATNYRGYLRDEVYSFGIVFLLSNGKQTDEFHIPGRKKLPTENLAADIPETNEDFVGTPYYTSGGVGYSPYWAIYNTASVIGTSPEYTTDSKYKGPYQYGEFAYWESTDTYPCNTDVWGDLAGKPIRHHKFPDVSISPILESKTFSSVETMTMGNDAIFPIGVKIDSQRVKTLIDNSSLTQEQKDDIVGYKIVRGDRATNKSIVAKGILRNVGEYERDGKEYYFPNYPYNDLRDDPFINQTNNAYTNICESFDIETTALEYDGTNHYTEIEYLDCNTNKIKSKKYYTIGETERICAIEKPTCTFGEANISYVNYDVYRLESVGMVAHGWKAQYEDRTNGISTVYLHGTLGDRSEYVNVVPGTIPTCIEQCDDHVEIELISEHREASSCETPTLLPPPTNKYIQIFNSPETSFGQPFIGDVLKLESVIFGKGVAHFTEVKDNAKYKLVTKDAQRAALDSAAHLGGLTDTFDATAMFTAYQAYLQIYINGITRKNYAYSFNSIADYNYAKAIPDNKGIKQRNIDVSRYLIPSVISIEDDNINNWQRETSVFIKTEETKDALPFPHESENMLSGTIPILTEYSRFTISEAGNCDAPSTEEDIQTVSYYASIKNSFLNQWGQIYSYNTVDTGYQHIFDSQIANSTIFGGDTFISRFAFKTKLPFFIDNRVGAPDDSDIFYDEIGNIGYPKYWHSSRSILEDYSVPPGEATSAPGILANLISYKAHNFDCPNDTTIASSVSTTTTSTTSTISLLLDILSGDYPKEEETSSHTYYDGCFYLFAYGIPYFYCETSYNTDLRQAFNNKEGDFWPHVSSSIPDDWVQETNVSIANDNTYYYNVSYSKQNKENYFSHLPADWEDKLCYTHYPFRTIYSDQQNVDSDNRINAWRVYRAISYFDFPQNYGALISLDGIQNRAILARFENKSLMYNNLLTIDTSNPQAAYLGNPTLFKGAPPIDFAETDLGYAGTQNKMLLKIPQGQVSVDAKRGQVFLINGTDAIDLSAFGSGLNRWFTDHLAFEILRYFPTAKIDNNFNGIGLHGVYDSKYDRVILTKLDYVPISDEVQYDDETDEYYIEEEIDVEIPDCYLWGNAVQISDCQLAGTAAELSTTTTSTTV